MNSKSQINLGETHLRFPCVQVVQGPQVTFYVGALSFSDLWPLCTVTPREPRSDDPLYSDTPKPKVQTAQREVNEDRVEKIADFVEKLLAPVADARKEAIFPGTVILGLLADVEEMPQGDDKPSPTAALVGSQEMTDGEVWLPRLKASLFIIDGQHRLKGLARLEERLIEDAARLTMSDQAEKIRIQTLMDHLRGLKIPMTVLVDFDLAEQAVVFATVNFNQKTVPRSLYFDIFGAFESDRVTPIGFCHELVLHLNNSSKSPLHDMVKLLGTGPGLITQAFLGARLSFLVDPELPKAVLRQFLVRRQREDKTASRELATLMHSFFGAVKDELAYAWPTPFEGRYSAYHYKFILCKSMAMSGLVAIMGDIYRLALLDFALGREMDVARSGVLDASFFAAFLCRIDPEGRQDSTKSCFARGKEWSIGGSAVVEKRIYEQLREWVALAYCDQLLDPQSNYRRLISKFKGEERVSGAAISNISRGVNEFWRDTERIWTEARCGG